MKNNYFLLFHSASYEQGETELLLNTNDKNFDEIASFFLGLSQQRLEYFLKYDEFKKLSKKIITNGFLDSSSLFDFCFLVLQRIELNPSLAKIYLDTFSYLSDVNLIAEQENEKLKTIFSPLLRNSKKQTKNSDNFLRHKDLLNSFIDEVTSLLESKKLEDDLKFLSEYVSKKVFSIGITGVMNVGKSTFINALLGEELLGSSVIAETANISILRYSKEPYAKVNFFNRLEFDELLHTLQHSINDKIDIDRYIKDESLCVDIEQSQLKLYTSASDSVGLSDIVKNVELGVNLEFLKDSIEIVDTPGIDDTLILRETITKNYVQNCDLLIYLMNVNQSATQKDVDFIIESVNNQNLSSILILLTKVDNINKDELQEVMTYTKDTIQSQVSTNIPIEFMSLSAKTNLGVSEVKEYLKTTLFDSETKNSMMLTNASVKLKGIIEEQVKAYNYMLLLYSKDELSLDAELREFNKIKDLNKESIKTISAKIDEEYQEYERYLAELNVDAQSELDGLKNKVLDRVSSELIYSFKNDAKVKERQLLMLVDKSVSHGYIDIIREYKYKLKKYMLGISKKIELDFKEHNIKVKEINDEDSMSELFGKNSNSSLNTNIKMISKKLNLIVGGVKASKIDKFKTEFLNILDEEFTYISKNIHKTKEDLTKQSSQEFFNSLKEPIDKLSLDMNETESILASQIYKLQNNDEDIEISKINIAKKINSLNLISGSLL